MMPGLNIFWINVIFPWEPGDHRRRIHAWDCQCKIISQNPKGDTTKSKGRRTKREQAREGRGRRKGSNPRKSRGKGRKRKKRNKQGTKPRERNQNSKNKSIPSQTWQYRKDSEACCITNQPWKIDTCYLYMRQHASQESFLEDQISIKYIKVNQSSRLSQQLQLPVEANYPNRSAMQSKLQTKEYSWPIQLRYWRVLPAESLRSSSKLNIN